MITLAAAGEYYRGVAHRAGLAAAVCAAAAALLNTLQSTLEAYVLNSEGAVHYASTPALEAVHTLMLVLAQICIVVPRVLFLHATQGIASRANKLLAQAAATLDPKGIRERYDHLLAEVPPMPCLLTHPAIRWDDPSAAPVLAAAAECRQIDLPAVVRYYTNLRTACVVALALEWAVLSALGVALAVLHHDRHGDYDNHSVDRIEEIGAWCIVLQCSQAFVVVLAHKVPLHKMATACSRIVRLAMVGMTPRRSVALDAELQDELASFHCCGETRFTPCEVSAEL